MKRAATSYLTKHDKRRWHHMVRSNHTSSRAPTSNKIRQLFLDYFIKEHGHTFIRSSPVFPLCDPTVPFVNAGMNQFKGIFLGNDTPPCVCAVNSQKCIRVSGKHNDLNSVGKDGYHHTFFEMLGNWSFGDYFKYDACEMAWNLLIGPFNINPQRLYVTYFGGDRNLNLEADFETKEIWKKIGLPEERILPFGIKDNFWEMGVTGPCGPCTEIHIDHHSDSRFVPDRVNKNLSDVTELWNLVFIQFKRDIENKLNPLPKHHVDTGMGFERLVAILQGKQSNYDTDLFTNLFTGIAKESNSPSYTGLFDNSETHIDYSYRVLADHIRMITVALSDGMRPDQNPKLRRILRKAFLISEQSFNVKSGLLKILTNYVAETLSDAYPEINKNLSKVQLIIEHEENLFESLRKTAHTDWKKIVGQKPELKLLNTVESPGLVAGFQFLQSFVNEMKGNLSPTDRLFLPIDTAVILFQRFGLDIDTIEQLASAEGLEVDINAFEKAINAIKLDTKMQSSQNAEDVSVILNQLIESGVKCTDDSFKYDYVKDNSGKYVFPELRSCIKSIIVNGQMVSNISECPSTCEVLLDRTNFYCESGGQSGDVGTLILPNGSEINITEIRSVGGFVLHKITSDKNFEMKVGDEVVLKIDSSHRLCNMQNHTATHLVNAGLRQIFPITYQKSSHISPSYFTFDFSYYGDVLKPQDIIEVESNVLKAINSCVPVNRYTVTANELLAMNDVTLIPGVTYPDSGIHIIEIQTDHMKSKEACCGTHVLNTGDIEKFHIVNIENSGRGTKSLHAVSGHFADLVEKQGFEINFKVEKLSYAIDQFLKSENATAEEAEELNDQLVSLRRHIYTCNGSIPYSVYIFCLEKIENLGECLKKEAREFLRDSLRLEMKRVLKRVSEQREPYIVHFLSCSSSVDNVPLLHATRMCPNDLPVIVLCRSEGLVKARCCVPESLVSERFSAELWMQSILSSFKAEGGPPRGQDPHLVFNMKKKKIPDNVFENLLVSAIKSAKTFADNTLNTTQPVKRRQDTQ